MATKARSSIDELHNIRWTDKAEIERIVVEKTYRVTFTCPEEDFETLEDELQAYGYVHLVEVANKTIK